jgi:TonB family protein
MARIGLAFKKPEEGIVHALPEPKNAGFTSGTIAGSGDVSAPQVLYKVDPEYSEEARAAKRGGTVTLSITVDPEGRASDIHVVKGLGMGLDEKAIEAVRKWKFKPGMNKGAAVSASVSVDVTFR